MMSRLESQVGRVGSVDDVLAGSVLLDDHAAGENVLRVVDAAGFSEAGGQVVVEGTVLAYTSADLATDVLTLVEPLAAWTESDTPAQVYPPAPTRVAAVEIDGSDEPLSAVVPQSLLDQVPTGLRGEDDAETVLVDLVDGQWQLVDLVAVPSRAVDREQVEQIAIGIADGKTQHSMRLVDAAPAPLPAAPTTDGRVVGDTHHDLTSGTGVVRAAYILTGDGWEAHSFGDEVVDSVAAGKILGGVITALLRLEAAGELVVGSEDDIHVRIHEGRIDVMRPGEAGEPAQPYISMGRGSDGAFRVLDADDGVLGGIMPDGAYEGPEVRGGVLIQDGTPIDDLIGPRLMSLGVDRTPPGVVYGPYGVDMPLWEATIDLPALHTLFMDTQGWMRGPAGGLSLLRCSYTVTTDGSLPPRPTGGSTELTPHAPVPYATSSWQSVAWSWRLGSGATPARVRLLVWISREGGADPQAASFTFHPQIAAVRGASGFSGVVRARPGSTTPSDPAPAPPPPLVPRPLRYDLGPHALWINNGVRATQGYRLQDVQIGRSPSGTLHRTHILLPQAARSAISAAETLVSARVRLAASETPPSIRPHIGTITSADITGSSEPPSRNIDPGSRTYTDRGPSGWTELGSRTLAALAAGDPGLILTYASTSQTVGRFHGPGASGSLRPQIEITTRSRT